MTNRGIRLVLALMSVSLFLLVRTPEARAAESGLYIDVKESAAPGARVVERWKLYGSSHALVIGIDNYTGGWPKLSNAVRDARELSGELTDQGFQVTLLTDPDSGELRESLRSFYALRGADPEARLLLWFAGHGHTINGEGFLVPADAPPASDPRFKVKALHMRDFGGLMRLADSKHVLAVFDSCFSGTIFTTRAGAANANITHKTRQPVRQFITSGDAGQRVRDDGSFRKLFVRALRGEELADANADGYLTGEELGLYLSQRMTNLTQAAQTPRYGRLQDVNFDQGDFVFALPADAVAAGGQPQPSQPVPSEASLDLSFWNSIRDSADPAQFQAYLEAFPNGRFATLARVKANAGDSGAGQDDRPQQAALPPEGIARYEGAWRGTLVPGNCPVAADVSSSYKVAMDIAGGKISGTITGAQSMRLSGRVDDDGNLQDLSANFPEGMIRIQGKLGPDSGSGKWRAVGLRCRGSFSVSKKQ